MRWVFLFFFLIVVAASAFTAGDGTSEAATRFATGLEYRPDIAP